MRRAALALTVALAGCGLFEPTFWCSETSYFAVADSLWELPDTVDWNLTPDSVVTVWSVDGECVEDARPDRHQSVASTVGTS